MSLRMQAPITFLCFYSNNTILDASKEYGRKGANKLLLQIRSTSIVGEDEEDSSDDANVPETAV